MKMIVKSTCMFISHLNNDEILLEDHHLLLRLLRMLVGPVWVREVGAGVGRGPEWGLEDNGGGV
jgi:hypothetical protein